MSWIQACLFYSRDRPPVTSIANLSGKGEFQGFGQPLPTGTRTMIHLSTKKMRRTGRNGYAAPHSSMLGINHRALSSNVSNSRFRKWRRNLPPPKIKQPQTTSLLLLSIWRSISTQRKKSSSLGYCRQMRNSSTWSPRKTHHFCKCHLNFNNGFVV